MEIRTVQASEIEAARRLLAANGWERRVADPERFRQLLRRSQHALVTVEARSSAAMELRRAEGQG